MKCSTILRPQLLGVFIAGYRDTIPGSALHGSIMQFTMYLSQTLTKVVKLLHSFIQRNIFILFFTPLIFVKEGGVQSIKEQLVMGTPDEFEKEDRGLFHQIFFSTNRHPIAMQRLQWDVGELVLTTVS